VDNNRQVLKKTEKDKEKLCPFNPKLSCEECRFYQPYIGGEGKRECIFIVLSWRIN